MPHRQVFAGPVLTRIEVPVDGLGGRLLIPMTAGGNFRTQEGIGSGLRRGNRFVGRMAGRRGVDDGGQKKQEDVETDSHGGGTHFSGTKRDGSFTHRSTWAGSSFT